jgi:uncharacterized protein (DUF1499 family)
MAKKFFLLLGLLALVAAATAWPRLNDVETGRTPEYPELRPRDYAASEDSVLRAAKQCLERLPRWSFVGAGSGPAGSELRAVHATRVFGFKDDVTIRIGREAARTHVSVRSRSRIGAWDFGQNARNIRELLGELDRALGR